ncbi:MAG: NAD+ synthase [Bacteroidia bacterium]
MKIALAQFNYHVGNLTSNVAKIKDGILRAKKEEAELVVFSELSVCGYPPKDLLQHNGFISACEKAVLEIANECRGIAAIIGAPARNPHKGRALYNSAFFLADGKILAQVNKTLLPFYDVFDEYRYFEPASENELVEYKGFKIAIIICEDLWNELPRKNRFFYKHSPLETLCTPDTNCIINISASPFSYIHRDERRQLFNTTTSRYKLPLFYINALGANTDLIFDGGSLVMDNKSSVVDEMNYFSEDLSFFELNVDKTVKAIAPPARKRPAENIECIYEALVLGIRDYFQKNNLTDAVLGLSGGIDSALVLVLAAEALGNKNVHAMVLPSRYTSEESLRDAAELIVNIGCHHETISIEPGVIAANKSLSKAFAGRKPDITEENIQSRMRSLLLMAVSNKFGYLLLNTSNKSELATGYGTLYGDMSGALAVIGDVYKTQVFELARYINSKGIKSYAPAINAPTIPEDIITRPPTAELKPDQKDTDTLPEYAILDKILYQYIEMELSASDIKVEGASADLIEKIVAMVNRNEYKRQQAPPVLRISPKAFGAGRKMPIVGKYL